MHAQRDVLDVQEDVDDVFLHTFNRAVLMHNAVNLHFGDCRTRNGRQQNATQRVTQRVAKSTLHRLERDLGTVRANLLNVDVARLEQI